MHHFQDGEEARVMKNGAEVSVIVFRQLGEAVYVFDSASRAYLFHVKDVRPATMRCRAPHAAKGDYFRMADADGA